MFTKWQDIKNNSLTVNNYNLTVRDLIKKTKKELIIRLKNDSKRLRNKIPKKAGIYLIFNVSTNKCYIGSSINLHKRLLDKHLPSLKNNNHINEHLQSSWNKYGSKSFIYLILETFNRDVDIKEREQFYFNKILMADKFIDNNDNFFVNNSYNKRPVSEYNRSLAKLISKKILQYKITGEFIREWDSSSEASDILNIKSITNVCRGEKFSAGGFIWKFKESDEIPLKIKIKYRKQLKSIPILQYDLNGNFIREWENRTEIKKVLGFTIAVSNKVNHNRRSFGFIWKFKKSDKIIKKIKVPKIFKGLANRKVLQYDLEGNLLKVWENTTQIKNELGLKTITASCNNKTKTLYGFIWRYSTEDKIPIKIDSPTYYEHTKNVLQYSSDGKFIKEWFRTYDITKELKLSFKLISRVCLGQRKTYAGFIWKYKENDDYPLQLDMTINGRKDVIKKVEQYDLDGKFIKTWDSINSAQKTLKCGGIFSALKKGKNISCGFVWKLVE
jgi:group I intron endonuclease